MFAKHKPFNAISDNVDRVPDGSLPRWTFSDFLNRFMRAFHVWSGEWIETVGYGYAIPLFLTGIIVIRYMVVSIEDFNAMSLTKYHNDIKPLNYRFLTLSCTWFWLLSMRYVMRMIGKHVYNLGLQLPHLKLSELVVDRCGQNVFLNGEDKNGFTTNDTHVIWGGQLTVSCSLGILH